MRKQTASQTVGPYFRIGLIYGERQNDLVEAETAGTPVRITGQVFDGDGEPIVDAMIEIWQPDANGIFNHPADPRHQEADPHFFGFGRVETDQDGRYEFKTIKPGARDGHAPYINLRLFARGMLIHALTRLYFAGEPLNATDPVWQSVAAERRATLLATREEASDPPVYRFDIRLQGDEETVFFNP